ncbi:GATA transcription factor 4 [Dioscorea cayenensis subsp. rotundata]|uniref:GATA transcription factor n=1 Tax=Dioscorea cayennensis subsp. rotundata TaxID=55577 RepID=A0AB40CQ42_DIOCR|nr:GATA transcription factor 4 [Dioscorea cayenensis subsp. rotundata]
MSPGWEMGFASSAPSFNKSHSTSPAYLYDLPSSDTLRIDDLLDFTNNHEDFLLSSSATTDSHSLPPPDPSSSYPSDSSNIYSFPSSTTTTFPDDLYIPSEEAAELEWLSRFVDDSFADVPPSSIYTPISNQQHQPNQHQHHYQHQQQQQQQHLLIEPCSAPGRARSKRSKANSWSMASQSSSPSTSSSSSDLPSHAGKKDTNNYNNNNNNGSINSKGKSCAAGGEASGGGGGGGVRRCTHCASEKTPQWRTGPLGPKTLCNACGVRYKSGRLVPEYRPAASPTFVLTQHSNSHRKVLELRRQKELAAARSELLFHDYEVC